MGHRYRDDSSTDSFFTDGAHPQAAPGEDTTLIPVADYDVAEQDTAVHATRSPVLPRAGWPATESTATESTATESTATESPTDLIPVLRLTDAHEELLERFRLRQHPGKGRVEDLGASGIGHHSTSGVGQHSAPRSHRQTRRAGPLAGWATSSARHPLRHALAVAASFVCVLAVSAAAVAGLAYKRYNGQIKRVAVLQTKDPNIVEPARQLNAENFLIIGSDHRAKDDSGYGEVSGARSDTTIIVHLSPDHQKATVISIPRDSWVDIPDCKGADGTDYPEHSDMFNSAFSEGGASCTIATVQKLTGIAITHYLEVDFDGFQKMVAAMGTVSICSPQAVYDPDSGLRLQKGMNALNGTQALAYVRARHALGDGSDLGRIKRQQVFMGAVLRQAMTGTLLSNPLQLSRFLDAATRSITVDKGTSFSDLRVLAESLQGLDPARVLFYTAPIANSDYSPPGTSQTGKVLLDPTAGQILYGSVINDVKPVWVTKSGATTSTSAAPSSSAAPAATSSAAAPQPNTNAANTSCSI